MSHAAIGKGTAKRFALTSQGNRRHLGFAHDGRVLAAIDNRCTILQSSAR